MNMDKLIDYECGLLDQEETLELFADLIKTGMCWTLQGHYGRTAQSLLEQGYISEQGEVLM